MKASQGHQALCRCSRHAGASGGGARPVLAAEAGDTYSVLGTNTAKVHQYGKSAAAGRAGRRAWSLGLRATANGMVRASQASVHSP